MHVDAGFQPTRPLRGATHYLYRPFASVYNFNPRAPCGARPNSIRKGKVKVKISTHAPLAGRDAIAAVSAGRNSFQPTRPLRGATTREIGLYLPLSISTHAPLAGRDLAR